MKKTITWEEAYKTCLPAIKMSARKFAAKRPDGLNIDDLVNVGLLGLMDALKKYDPKKNSNFTAYALFRVRGAMLDEIRKVSWIPRSANDRLKLYRQKKQELQNNGVEPDKKTLRLVTNLSEEQLQEIERVDHIQVVSYDTAIHQTFLRPHLPEERVRSKEVIDHMHRVLQTLPEKMRMVLKLRLIDEMNLGEVADILSLSEARISQLHNKGIGLLRTALKEHKELLSA